MLLFLVVSLHARCIIFSDHLHLSAFQLLSMALQFSQSQKPTYELLVLFSLPLSLLDFSLIFSLLSLLHSHVIILAQACVFWSLKFYKSCLPLLTIDSSIPVYQTNDHLTFPKHCSHHVHSQLKNYQWPPVIQKYDHPSFFNPSFGSAFNLVPSIKLNHYRPDGLLTAAQTPAAKTMSSWRKPSSGNRPV